jgi:hypothetical protein
MTAWIALILILGIIGAVVIAAVIASCDEPPSEDDWFV